MFQDTASSVMLERKFNLRGWELSGEPDEGKPTNVLGLWWHKFEDTLAINVESLTSMKCDVITKKTLLSAAHRLYDPFGLVSSVALVPKLLVQETWRQNLGWTEEVDDDVKNRFLKWLKEIPLLGEVKIQRWIGVSGSATTELHVFADACKTSYATVIFLRVKTEQSVQLHLLASKARVAPTSKSKIGMTIPRLELLAASIAARLYTTVVQDYKLKGVKTVFWTDATTVLAWLLRNSPWDVFVHNRVSEVRDLTVGCEWRHVPGEQNPADLPSRGCAAKKFVKSKWWEGPNWLKEDPENWPQSDVSFDESEINMELKKSVVSAMVSTVQTVDTSYYQYFSSYPKLIRMIA
uniref:Uncharacterized protein n=1 Tax=Cacopsylla melanoneura TaxID=428564 RepID=A0A8D8X4P5_9HEMI